jgi:protein gp37
MKMIDKKRLAKGLYWQEAWNPILDPENGRWGCTKISEGCKFCWAQTMNHHRFGGAPYDGRKRNFILDEKMLTKPIRARKAKVYFVCITMDLFI